MKADTNKYKPYYCETCTFYNEENPGPSCSVCMAQAPESAIIKVEKKDSPKKEVSVVKPTGEEGDMLSSIVTKKIAGDLLTIKEQLFENKNKE